MAMDSIEQLLDIPIDHYVTINLDGMEDLINAVGGIKVNNKIDFTWMVSMYQQVNKH